ETLERPPRARVNLERLLDVRRHRGRSLGPPRIPVSGRRALAPSRREQPERLDLRVALAVRIRPKAVGLPRRELARVAIVVETADQAVDPAEAQRFLDGVLVLDRRLARVRLVIHEPDLDCGVVIRLEPCAPPRAAAKVERLRFRRHAHFPESPLNIRVPRGCAKLNACRIQSSASRRSNSRGRRRIRSSSASTTSTNLRRATSGSVPPRRSRAATSVRTPPARTAGACITGKPCRASR